MRKKKGETDKEKGRNRVKMYGRKRVMSSVKDYKCKSVTLKINRLVRL